MNDGNKPQTPGAEPSMEEILASIRRIISEDGTPAAPAAPAAPAKPAPAAQPAPQPTPVPKPEPKPAPAPVRPAPPVEEPVLELTQMVSPPTGGPAEALDDEPGIASNGTIAASAAVFSELQQPAPQARPAASLPLGNGALTLEDMVRGELRPLLRQWLDSNLPGIVERLVQREIQRITRSVDPS